jgi:hypothetical protein
LLVPWLTLLGLLGVARLILSAKARNAWNDYRGAEAAAERLSVNGATTVIRDRKLYVRVDPDSLAQGRLGNWYAQVVSVEFRDGGQPSER